MNITIDTPKLSYDIFSKKKPPINFKSTKRSIIDNNSVKIVGNYTNMFRNDIDWDKLIDLIIETNCKHIYSLACSDGSEAYSIAIALIERLGRNAKRYKPIFASDSNQYIINEANSGYINLRDSDIAKINQITRNSFKLNRKQIILPDDATYNSKYIGEYTPIQKITNGVLYK